MYEIHHAVSFILKEYDKSVHLMMAGQRSIETVSYDSSVETNSQLYSSATIPDDSPIAIEPENVDLYDSKSASISQNITEDYQTQQIDRFDQVDQFPNDGNEGRQLASPRLPESNPVSTTEIADLHRKKEYQHQSIDQPSVSIEARAKWAMLASLAGVSRANVTSEYLTSKSKSKSEIDLSTEHDHREIQDERTQEEEVDSQSVRLKGTSISALNQADVSNHQFNDARDSTLLYNYENETMKQNDSSAHDLSIEQYLHSLEMDPHIDTRGLKEGRLSLNLSSEMHIRGSEHEEKTDSMDEGRDMGDGSNKIHRLGEYSKDSEQNAGLERREQGQNYPRDENHEERILKEDHQSLPDLHSQIRHAGEELQGRDPRNQVLADKHDLDRLERGMKNHGIRNSIREGMHELEEDIGHGAERFKNDLEINALQQRMQEVEHVKESFEHDARNVERENHGKQLLNDVHHLEDALKGGRTFSEHEIIKQSTSHDHLLPSQGGKQFESSLRKDFHKAESTFQRMETNSLEKPVHKVEHGLTRIDKGIREAGTGIHTLENSNLSKSFRDGQQALNVGFRTSVDNAKDKLSSSSIGQGVKRGEQYLEENLQSGERNLKVDSKAIARKVEEGSSGHKQAEEIRKGAQSLTKHLQISNQELKKEVGTMVAKAHWGISDLNFRQDAQKVEQAAKQDLEKGADFLKNGIENVDGRRLAEKISREGRSIDNNLDRLTGSAMKTFGFNDRGLEHNSPSLPSGSLKRSSAQRYGQNHPKPSPNLPAAHSQPHQIPSSSSPQFHDSVATPTKGIGSGQRPIQSIAGRGAPQSQRPAVGQGASPSQGNLLQQRPPPPPQLSPHQGLLPRQVPPHQDPSSHLGLPPHQGSQTPQRSSPHQGPPLHQTPPPHQGKPPYQSSPTPQRQPPHQGLPPPQGPPLHQTPVQHQELPPHQGSSPYPPPQTPQRPPPHQGLPLNQETPPHQGPSQIQRPPLGQVRLSGQTPPKQQGPRSIQGPSPGQKPPPSQGPSAVHKPPIGHSLSPGQNLPQKQHPQQTPNLFPNQGAKSGQGLPLDQRTSLSQTPTPGQGKAPSQESPHAQGQFPKQESKLVQRPPVGREPPPAFNLSKPNQINQPLISAPRDGVPHSAKSPDPVADRLRGTNSAPTDDLPPKPQAPNIKSNDQKGQIPMHGPFSKNDQIQKSPREDGYNNQQPRLPIVPSQKTDNLHPFTAQTPVTHSTHNDTGADRSKPQAIQPSHNRRMDTEPDTSYGVPQAATQNNRQLLAQDINQQQSTEGKEEVRNEVRNEVRTEVRNENSDNSTDGERQAAPDPAPQPGAVTGVENMLAMMKEKSDAAIEAADGSPGFLDREFLFLSPQIFFFLF